MEARLRAKAAKGEDDAYTERRKLKGKKGKVEGEVEGEEKKSKEEKTDAETLADLGIQKEYSPLLNNKGEPRCFMLDNNHHALYSLDLLHCQGGGADKLFNVARFFYMPRFVKVSQMVGNHAHGTPKGMIYYKHEQKVRHMFFVLVAALHVTPKAAYESSEPALINLLAGFLQFNACAKDDCPGKVRQELESCTTAMDLCASHLKPIYEDSGKTLWTLKLHILVKHAAALQPIIGSLKRCSTYDGEEHQPESHRAVGTGSLRKDDQAMTVLKHTFHSRIFCDAEYEQHDFSKPPTSFKEGSKFVLTSHCSLVIDSDLPQFVSECVGLVNTRLISLTRQTVVGVKAVLRALNGFDILEVGKSLVGMSICESSQKMRKTDTVFHVTGFPSKEKFTPLVAVSYLRLGLPLPLPQRCRRTAGGGCRGHSGVQLLCSFADQSDSDWGFIVLCFKTKRDGKLYALVLRLDGEFEPKWNNWCHTRNKSVKFKVSSIIGMYKPKFASLDVVPVGRLRHNHDACLLEGVVTVCKFSLRTIDHGF